MGTPAEREEAEAIARQWQRDAQGKIRPRKGSPEAVEAFNDLFEPVSVAGAAVREAFPDLSKGHAENFAFLWTDDCKIDASVVGLWLTAGLGLLDYSLARLLTDEGVTPEMLGQLYVHPQNGNRMRLIAIIQEHWDCHRDPVKMRRLLDQAGVVRSRRRRSA